MGKERQRVGRQGEDEACLYLIKLGHTIVERNWRYGHLETDIISLIGNELHFVEVKSRTEPVAADPEVNVNRNKRRRIVSCALAYLNSEKRAWLPEDLELCLDVITVVFRENEDEIEYYPKAFIPIYD
ncbi:MAG: YraN family protein [Bacteroidales bacterium]|nr:YraN family protein [Bacteroidales bacterium]